MTTHADLPEVFDRRIVAGWALGEWADRLLEQAGLGVTIVDRHGVVIYYNKWASEHQACTLVEELTAKELEVLGLLATRLSRREIGQRLYVSLNTVKTHQRALYRKLGVQDRSTAVNRARQLDLL
jgi:ATP/maltotriose-dependent transcriptional regulator MalT